MAAKIDTSAKTQGFTEFVVYAEIEGDRSFVGASPMATSCDPTASGPLDVRSGSFKPDGTTLAVVIAHLEGGNLA